jgi:hypothetical protein
MTGDHHGQTARVATLLARAPDGLLGTHRYKSCTGQQCLGNPGTGTPALAYGTATGVGPFLCTSASTGVTCTAGGKGFRISTSGVSPVSA